MPITLTAALAALDLACGAGAVSGDGDAGPKQVASRSSRGSSIAVSEDGSILAVANKGTDDVTLFDLPDLTERARIAVGDEPVSVVFAPDGDTLYVVNRASGSVSVVTGATSDAPQASATVAVGSEPSHAALSPTGSWLYVSNWADGTLSVIDTDATNVARTVELGGAPYAVCTTNDGDQDDDDESVYVTDFYSRPGAGQEGTDGSRVGRVFRVHAVGEGQIDSITLDPLVVRGIAEDIDAASTSAFANQLYSCALNGDHLYVTAVGASPASFDNGTDFRQNVHGLVYAIDVANHQVDDDRTVNLSELIAALDGEKRFAAVPHDIAFVDGTDFAYIAVMTSNSVLRVDFGATPPVAGSPSGAAFLPVEASPTGIAINKDVAYSNNEVARTVSQIDLASQTTQDSVASAPQPTGAADIDVLLGQKFFNTGLARWSSSAWVGCVSCHPFGTTDNVTWVFPAGPRQTVDTAATFDAARQHQRMLNWTAIFDEVHDFELNTRGVAGGVGAIVSSEALDPANRLNFLPGNGFNLGSVRGINQDSGVLDDWDRIEAYIASIRSPRGAAQVQGDPIAGRAVFEQGRCDNCHAGPLWTSSERYYQPIVDGDLRARSFADEGINSLGAVRADQTVLDDLGFDTAILGDDLNGPPQRHLCVIRDVGTFGAAGPDSRGASEVRQNGATAQGGDGFNIPSLLGINTGSPYLHNGAAETLEELLSPDGDFADHLRAGNQVFAPSDEQVADLIAFLRTIDDTTATFDIPSDQVLCPVGVVPPVLVPE